MNESNSPSNFIRDIINEDLARGTHTSVMTRFPPEPNGYLHIGHAKSICLNFGLARDYNGVCNLRFDDTNPAKEEVEYVDSIKEDVRWLGFDWENREYFASDYFEQLYQYAVHLIDAGKAYVDSLSAEEIRDYRGTLTEPGRNSPYRDRSVKENRDLFERMRAGEFPDGAHVLRAKIDMAAPNLSLRDPTIYRIRKVAHHRTGDQWCVYPLYDFAHGLSDAIEGVTHSICTLEFENNRALYDWFLDNLPVKNRPRQYEFARLNLTYTVLSKRKLLKLVQENIVEGWDDPRMPTLSGLRRRGYTPDAIRNFCDRIGVAKRDSTVDLALLEFSIREDLNDRAPRFMGVLNPLRVVIENYPEGREETLEALNHPTDERFGTREIPFGKVLYIERDDFREDPPKKFFRLAPGREVRLRYAYFITCVDVVKDPATGEVVELRCTYDPATRGGNAAGHADHGIALVAQLEEFNVDVLETSVLRPLEVRGHGIGDAAGADHYPVHRHADPVPFDVTAVGPDRDNRVFPVLIDRGNGVKRPRKCGNTENQAGNEGFDHDGHAGYQDRPEFS